MFLHNSNHILNWDNDHGWLLTHFTFHAWIRFWHAWYCPSSVFTCLLVPCGSTCTHRGAGWEPSLYQEICLTFIDSCHLLKENFCIIFKYLYGLLSITWFLCWWDCIWVSFFLILFHWESPPTSCTLSGDIINSNVGHPRFYEVGWYLHF